MIRSAVLALGALTIAGSPALAHPETPEKTVLALFDAMRAGDGAAIRSLVRPAAVLQRVEADGVRDSTFDAWATWVDTLDPGDADEQIFAVRVETFADLASVWAPFVIDLNGERVGCGVNHFTLARTGERWQIIHGVDVQDGGDCTTFQERYRKD